MNRFAWPVSILTGFLATTAPLMAQRAPAAAQTGLPQDVLALGCAPMGASTQPTTPLRVVGGQDAVTRRIYAPGDLVTINAGAANGIRVGQEFFVRRILTGREFGTSGAPMPLVHTAGWIRVWAVDDTMSLATVTHACDSIEVGDYLDDFTLPQPVTPNPNKPKAERDHYARVMPGTDLRSSFGRGDFFTINRGTREGVKPGAQFVIYRDKKEATNFLFELGEAVAVSVGENVSTLKVTLSRDAFLEGDFVAERR